LFNKSVYKLFKVKLDGEILDMKITVECYLNSLSLKEAKVFHIQKIPPPQ